MEFFYVSWGHFRAIACWRCYQYVNVQFCFNKTFNTTVNDPMWLCLQISDMEYPLILCNKHVASDDKLQLHKRHVRTHTRVKWSEKAEKECLFAIAWFHLSIMLKYKLFISFPPYTVSLIGRTLSNFWVDKSGLLWNGRIAQLSNHQSKGKLLVPPLCLFERKSEEKWSN